MAGARFAVRLRVELKRGEPSFREPREMGDGRHTSDAAERSGMIPISIESSATNVSRRGDISMVASLLVEETGCQQRGK